MFIIDGLSVNVSYRFLLLIINDYTASLKTRSLERNYTLGVVLCIKEKSSANKIYIIVFD